MVDGWGGDWDVDLDPPGPVNLNAVELQEGGYDIDLFVNREAAENFTCDICLAVAKNPRKHTMRDCRATFCFKCVDMFVKHHQRHVRVGPPFPECTRRCGYQLAVETTVTRLPRASFEMYENLEMKCINEGCNHIAPLNQFEAHIANCSCDPEKFCQYCQVPIMDHSCRDYIKELKDELALVKAQDESKAQRIELLENNVSSLEAEIGRLNTQINENIVPAMNIIQQRQVPMEVETVRQSRIPTYRGLSNHIRSNRAYRDSVTVHCRYRDQCVTIEGLDPDCTGLRLRRMIKERLGGNVGPIMMFQHTPLLPQRPLRQHQIVKRPTYLIALELGRPIADGGTLEIRVGPNGPLV